jgi:hypothetical protein
MARWRRVVLAVHKSERLEGEIVIGTYVGAVFAAVAAEVEGGLLYPCQSTNLRRSQVSPYAELDSYLREKVGFTWSPEG